MMRKHFIILSSAYSKGKRMARHYLVDRDMDTAEKDIKNIYEKCGKDVPISTHIVETGSDSWKSVYEKDAFFENVLEISTIERFIQLMLKDRVLKGIDIANYILSIRRFGHLKIEKLVYLCYADHLVKTGEKLFLDPIYAFEKGPVVKSVYDEFHKKIGPLPGKYDRLSIKSRILYADNGIDKKNTADSILKKYADMSSQKLILLTHRKGSPWDITDKTKRFAVITDDVIRKGHSVESK